VTPVSESILCVDLDGSLVATDLLAESALLLVAWMPLSNSLGTALLIAAWPLC
jgi:hypothetical protein